MELSYKESSFTIPYETNRDRNSLHKTVSNIVYNACDFQERKFIFGAKLIDFDNNLLDGNAKYVITVRAQQLSQSLYPRESTMAIDVGRELSLMVQVPCYKRIRGKESYIREHMWGAWFEQYILKKGFGNVVINGFKRENEWVSNHKLTNGSKNFHSFLIPTAVFYFTAIIFDGAKVSSAWINGVGRSKAFGFGLIETNCI